MELVEGEDLSERLKRGPIPVDEAVAIARQIAEALEEAHEKGVVHRDLKPANVKLTPDGKAKVLDFGLAKAWEGPGAASSDLSQSPTLAHTGTAAGLILGTAAYMSPEQARGKAVDRRADIWAFGVVLFEMLTGRKLFEGETVSDVLAAVLTREPQWAALPPRHPGRVRRLLERCLERDPKLRLRDIGEARVGLLPERLTEAPSSTTTALTRGQWLLRAAPWLLALGLGAAALFPRGEKVPEQTGPRDGPLLLRSPGRAAAGGGALARRPPRGFQPGVLVAERHPHPPAREPRGATPPGHGPDGRRPSSPRTERRSPRCSPAACRRWTWARASRGRSRRCPRRRGGAGPGAATASSSSRSPARSTG